MIEFLKKKIAGFNSDKKFSEIFTGSVYALAAKIVATAMTLVITMLVARLYGAGSLGVLAIVQSFAMLASIFTVFGTGTSILRLIPEHLANYSSTSAFLVYRKVQYLVAVVSLVSSALFFFGANIIAGNIFSKPHLSGVFAMVALFIIFKSLMELNTQAVRGLRNMRTFALMQIMPSSFMLLVLVALRGNNTNDPIYALVASWLMTALIGAWTMDGAFKKRMVTTDAVHPMPTKEIMEISLPMMMTQSMGFFNAQSGIVLLGVFRPAEEVGYYSIAVKLATLTAFVLQAINSIAAPKFSELFYSGKLDELFHVARKSSKLIFWTTSPILLLLLILGKPILGLFFGEEFQGGYLALVFLAFGQFVSSISGSTGVFMNMAGHQKVMRNIVLLSSILNVVISLLLIPRFGINGVAFATMFSLIFWNVVSLLYIKFKHGCLIGYFPSWKF